MISSLQTCFVPTAEGLLHLQQTMSKSSKASSKGSGGDEGFLKASPPLKKATKNRKYDSPHRKMRQSKKSNPRPSPLSVRRGLKIAEDTGDMAKIATTPTTPGTKDQNTHSASKEDDLVQRIKQSVKKKRRQQHYLLIQARVSSDDNWKKQLSISDIKAQEKEKREDVNRANRTWNKWYLQNWLLKHGKGKDHLEQQQRRKMMKRWFDFLDADGSGEIGIEELEAPLLKVGLARSKEEVEKLVHSVDKSHNGEINFEEFVDMMKKGSGSDGGEDGKENPIAVLFSELQKQKEKLRQSNNGQATNAKLPLPLLIELYSRGLLMDANCGVPGSPRQVAGQRVLVALQLAKQKKMRAEQIGNNMARKISTKKISPTFRSHKHISPKGNSPGNGSGSTFQYGKLFHSNSGINLLSDRFNMERTLSTGRDRSNLKRTDSFRMLKLRREDSIRNLKRGASGFFRKKKGLMNR
eukprot:g2122.t1